MNKIIKRGRQFFRAIFDRMTSADHTLVKQHLSEDEQRLFYKMDQAIQKHCVNVARTVMAMSRDNTAVNFPILIKAALLHDIGKIGGSFTVLDRVFYVVLRKFLPRLTVKLAQPAPGMFSRFRTAMHIHVTHADLGAAMAGQAGLTEELVYLLRNHHHHPEQADAPAELVFLIKADEIN